MAYIVSPDDYLTCTVWGVAVDVLLGKNVGALELIDAIEQGFSFSTFEGIVKRYRLTIQDLAATIGMSHRTLARRKIEQKLTKTESDRLASVVRLLAQASLLFENDEAKTVQWLNAPNRGLGGRTPLQMAQTEAGSREVEYLIGRLEHGVFS